MKSLATAALCCLIGCPDPVLAAVPEDRPRVEFSEPRVPVEEVRLANGLTLLLLPRAEATTVAAGWMVRAGSAHDPPDQTGISHVLEHMMFKGSRTVGTRDLDSELEALAEVDKLWNHVRALSDQLDRASATKRARLEKRLEAASTRLASAQTRADSLALLGEYSLLYSQHGGTDLNANTYRDLTLYYVTLPSEKLELWFWLESDRLLEPVLRQFYREVEVIHEERRQRIGSTPTGRLDEELRAVFWGNHPYSWNPMGRISDLDSLSRQDAYAFLRRNYRPDRMTVALVGGFETEQVRAWASTYFGRLPPASGPEPAEARPSLTSLAGKSRIEGTCACPSQIQVLYPSAKFGEPDADAMQVLSAVLNGRTGRLYRSLVLDQQIAFSAYTRQISWRRAGEFSFRAESRGPVDPVRLLEAWDRQVSSIASQAPTREEIERALNRSSADAFRSLKDPASLMKQLLIYQGLGDWRYINQWTARMREVTPERLVQAAASYLDADRRTVAIYRSEPPPELP